MVVILMGPTGCGKSTVGRMLARKLGWSFYDADDFHPPHNVAKMRSGIPLTDVDRGPWLERLREEIQRCVAERDGAVLACSALKRAYRERLGVDQVSVVTVYLKGSYELIRARIGTRRHPYMPPGLLRSQFDVLEEPEDGLCVDITPAPETIVRTIIESLDLASQTPASSNQRENDREP